MKMTLLGSLIFLFLWLVFRIRGILAPFLLALVITYVLNPPVEAMVRRRVSRVWAIIILYALAGLLLGAALVFLVPALVTELTRLGETVPEYTVRLQKLAREARQDFTRIDLPDSLRQALEQNLADLEGAMVGFIQRVLAATVGAVGGALSLLLAPVLAFYLLKDLDYFKGWLVASIPLRWRTETLSLLREMDRVVAGFIRGQLILAAIIGFLVAVAMAVLRVKFPLVLGIIAGAAEVIPYFGPIIGALPAVALALLENPLLAAKVIVSFFLIQQVESSLIAPKVVGDTVGLHPVAVIFSLLVGGELAGVPGLLLAVPVAGVMRVLGSYFWRKLAIETRQEAPD